MGNVKKHNRTLPLHPIHHSDDAPDMVFFEQIIKQEVQKAVHDAEEHRQVYYYPDMTSDARDKLHHIR